MREKRAFFFPEFFVLILGFNDITVNRNVMTYDTLKCTNIMIPDRYNYNEL